MNTLNKGMIITLDDNTEYVVLRVKEIDGAQYAYVQNINDKNDDGFVLIKGDSLEVVTETDKITYLMDNM